MLREAAASPCMEAETSGQSGQSTCRLSPSVREGHTGRRGGDRQRVASSGGSERSTSLGPGDASPFFVTKPHGKPQYLSITFAIFAEPRSMDLGAEEMSHPEQLGDQPPSQIMHPPQCVLLSHRGLSGTCMCMAVLDVVQHMEHAHISSSNDVHVWQPAKACQTHDSARPS